MSKNTTKTNPNATTRPPKVAASGGAAAEPVPAVTIRRKIEATPEELFDAWLDPESVVEWMRPNGIPSRAASRSASRSVCSRLARGTD